MDQFGGRTESETTSESPNEHLQLSFRATDDGLLVADPIERHQFRLSTPSAVSPAASDPTDFWFPADAAVRIRTDRIDLPTVVSVCVRDDDGEMLAQTEHFGDESFERGTYSVELFAPIKVYLRVTAPLSVSSDAEQTTIEFGEETTVLVGARSHHKRPAATITVPDDPRAVMEAMSYLGSALKTTTVERSYPTLRGHPPLLERGDSLDVPPGLEAPETGVTVELPAEYSYLYVAAPLVYYLGATVTEGPTPRIVTESGFEYDLDAPVGFEREVERVLKRAFFLDCLTRTEGYYDVDLHERRAVEDELDLDFAALYDRSLSEQLEAYLDVPHGVVESHVPEWKLTTHVAPTADNLELVPFVANDLAVVRTPDATPVTSSAAQASAVDEFLRASRPDGARANAAGDFTRSASPAAPSPEREYVRPERTDSLEQAWIGEGTPIGASKASLQAYRNRLNREPSEGDIGITVVCNDPEMAEERDVVEDVYGSREELPFDVRMHYDLTVDELREVLTVGTDFLHYIGHIDDDGFQCSDGALDVSAVDEVGTDAFLLNACQSYEQGIHLIDAGAIAGVVTLNDVVNSGAVKIGQNLCRLLNSGFPIRSALEIAKDDSVIGNDYIVVGDGGLAIAQSSGGLANLGVIERAESGYTFEFRTYPSSEIGMGSIVIPHISEVTSHYIASGSVDTFSMSQEDLQEFLSLEDIPILFEGELQWSTTFSSNTP
ncbi:hypothetical protein [Halopelagius longus]|uniref:Caspase family protein n=1 Tax=Halopelagius longus TaxID=1236180 RepID=A0A1H1B9V2_9EURY|nr:hypothetical protein [Halopelagius longus]RDI70699.1 hypothetical protein DWB78_02575 [Halopelagius longus]SDQ48660.1 hypothetical protein SAMN05216278_1701 [Halopelagius longus]